MLTLIETLADWVRNNWRPYTTTRETRPKIKVNAINVVWQTQKAAVEDELRDMLKMEDLTSKHQECFEQRSTAARRVLNKMTEQERTAIVALVEERRSQGNPESVRRE
jgi:hypothetical protein